VLGKLRELAEEDDDFRDYWQIRIRFCKRLLSGFEV
jgi:hypothetical protein